MALSAANLSNFSAALEAFMIFLNERSVAEKLRMYPESSIPADEFTFTLGGKYLKIVREGRGGSTSKSVYCFVKMEDGSIWKAASWKGPARNFSRGSLYSPARWFGLPFYGL